ncbi:hypothetical protein BGI30_06540 [Snodgrassella alvi]|nr:hypothetical protein BGI30_06540 [Snodgrassella alvi]PIT60419.1 hypothetical protein BHC59_00140 [Snodgrassella alvi]
MKIQLPLILARIKGAIQWIVKVIYINFCLIIQVTGIGQEAPQIRKIHSDWIILLKPLYANKKDGN